MGVQTGRDGHVALHHIPAGGQIIPFVVAIEKILDNNAFQHRVFGAEALLAVRVQIAHGGLLDSVVHGNAQRPCVAALAVFCLDGEGGGSRRSGYAADFSGFFVQVQAGRQHAFINAPCDGRCADGGQGMAVSLACLAVRQGIRGHDDGVGVWHKPRRERGYIRRNAITGHVELVVAAKPLKVAACISVRAGQMLLLSPSLPPPRSRVTSFSPSGPIVPWFKTSRTGRKPTCGFWPAASRWPQKRLE